MLAILESLAILMAISSALIRSSYADELLTIGKQIKGLVPLHSCRFNFFRKI